MSLKVKKVNMPISTHLGRHADGELRLRVQRLTRVDGFRLVEPVTSPPSGTSTVKITGVTLFRSLAPLRARRRVEFDQDRWGRFPWPTLKVGDELQIALHNDGEARPVTAILKLTEVT
jgi:hypothetical protein